MYNRLDQQVMTSHAMDLLQLTPAGTAKCPSCFETRVRIRNLQAADSLRSPAATLMARRS